MFFSFYRWKKPPISVCLGGQDIKKVASYKYLGIDLQYDLSFKDHFNNISSKALKTLGLLRRSLKHADIKTKLIVYYTLIRSGLEYAC